MTADDEWFFLDADPVHIKRERERARQLRGSAWWQRRLQRGVCAYCGGHFTATQLTMDHIVPLARGGRSNKGNIVAACRACNAKKKLLTPAEMILFARDATVVASAVDEDET